MYGFLLQDWTTLRVNFNVPSVTQDESGWVDLQPYQDVALWLDVKMVELLATGVTGIVFKYETSPTKDDAMFAAAATSSTLTASLSSPELTKVLLPANPAKPLARWLRWKLATVGTGTAGVTLTTFRVAVSANCVSAL